MARRECSVNRAMLPSLEVTAGEYLKYEASFRGARALFAVADESRELIFGPEHGSGRAGRFSREWPDEGESVDTGTTVHTFACQFIAALEYRYRVTHRNAAGEVLEELKDCTYTGEKPSDVVFSSLEIFVE